MNLGEFKEQVRASAKRGSAIDAQLPGFIRRAARWVEQNYTFQYMRRRVTLKLGAGLIETPLPSGVAVKELSPITVDWTWGRSTIAKTDLESLTANTVFPTQYALQGGTDLLFNVPFTEACIGWLLMVRFSDFPLADDETHWLLQNAEQLLLTQTMLNFMVDQRNDQGYQAVRSARDEAVKALLDADYATRYAGQALYSGI